MRRSFLGLAACLLSLVTSAVPATDRGSEPDTLEPVGGLTFKDEYELTLVNVLVYVTDHDNRPVTNLTADDFRITQDGQEREITNFETYTKDVYRTYYRAEDAPGVPQPTAAPSAEPPPLLRPIWMVIYVDHENLDPLDRNRTLNQLRTFIRDNLQPPVKMMVVSAHKSAKVIQDFTSDPALIQDALRSIRRDSTGRPTRDKERLDILRLIQQHAQDPGASSGNDSQRAGALITSFAEEEANDLGVTVGAIREIVSMLSGLPGKKAILYLSNGLPMVPGQELFYAYANAYDQSAGASASNRYNQSRKFSSLVALANAQDVTFYTIDASGLGVVGMGVAESSMPMDTTAAAVGQRNYQDTLRYLADRTGGLAIVNTNDASVHLDKIEGDFYTYYSIGYPLARTGGDKVHEIEVELKNPELKELTLRYRSRFVEKSLESQVRDKVQTSLMVPIEDNPMEVEVTTGHAVPTGSDSRWGVPVEVSFPLDSIALIPEGEDYVGRVVMFVAARGNGGKQSDLVRQDHEVRVPVAQYDQAKTTRFTITASLLMEEGRYTISIGLMDQVTRQASYRTLKTLVGG
jgi:VWFA-related protein